MLVEKGREVKMYLEFSSIISAGLKSKGKVLARGTTFTSCQASSGQRFTYSRNLPPTLARGGHLWAERKDLTGTQ